MIHQDMSPQTRGATGNIPQEVSHSAGEMFSDGEDAEVSLRTTRSVEVSQPSGPERSEASDTELEGKRTIMLENCAKEDLDIVKAALLHLLREDEDQRKVDMCDISELDKHLEESEGSRLSAGDIDSQLLSRLLDQVGVPDSELELALPVTLPNKLLSVFCSERSLCKHGWRFHYVESDLL